MDELKQKINQKPTLSQKAEIAIYVLGLPGGYFLTSGILNLRDHGIGLFPLLLLINGLLSFIFFALLKRKKWAWIGASALLLINSILFIFISFLALFTPTIISGDRGIFYYSPYYLVLSLVHLIFSIWCFVAFVLLIRNFRTFWKTAR